jgi:hypothetical protein
VLLSDARGLPNVSGASVLPVRVIWCACGVPP